MLLIVGVLTTGVLRLVGGLIIGVIGLVNSLIAGVLGLVNGLVAGVLGLVGGLMAEALRRVGNALDIIKFVPNLALTSSIDTGAGCTVSYLYIGVTKIFQPISAVVTTFFSLGNTSFSVRLRSPYELDTIDIKLLGFPPNNPAA